jgi:general secretion pathway protein B
MSFILDALKKSESDRQRKSGPALFEVKVAPPRTRLPLWAIAIALLLVVNLAIVAWMMLRHPSARADAGNAAPTPANLQGNLAAVPAVAGPSLPQPPPMAATSAAAPAAPAGSPGAALPATANTAALASPGAADDQNPEDYAPAAEPAPSLGAGHVRRDTADGVPLYQELSVAPGARLPQLRLDLHVYAARPQDRFVMINMHKLREGEALPEGVRLESVTPEGAVMSYNGSRFLLPRD